MPVNEAVMALPDASGVGGHGLEIVTALCGGYRVFLTANGKQVIAQVALG